MATVSDILQRVRLVLVDFDKFSQQVKSVGDQFEKLGSRMRRTGRTMSLAITAPIVGGFGVAVKAATDFESKMADVRKVVDFKTPKQFEELSKDLREMALRIPIAVDGLADIAAAAGQAGVAAEDLTKFTELVAQISVAFEMTAEEAGLSLAKLQTSLGLTVEEITLFTDQMNVLANGMASSEAEILMVVSRTASLGEMAGVARKDIAALGSAMVSMGVDSERASTAIRNILLSFQAGAAATKSQQRAWLELGTTSVEVAKRIQNEGIGVVIEIFEKIRSLAPEVRASILDQLFDKRVVDAAGPLINNMDVFYEALGLVQSELGVAGSALREFTVRAGTAESKFILFKNSLNELAIVVGNELLPVVLSVTEALTNFFSKADDFDKTVARWAIAITAAAAAIGPFVYGLGLLFSGIGKAIGLLTQLGFLLTGLRTAFMAAGVAGAIAFAPGTAIVVGLGLIAAAIGFVITRQTEAERAAGEHEIAIKELDAAIAAAKAGMAGASEELERIERNHLDTAEAALENARAHLEFLEAARRGERGPGAVVQAMDKPLQEAKERIEALTERVKELKDGLNEGREAVENFGSEVGRTDGKLEKLGDGAEKVGKKTVQMIRGGVETFESLGDAASDTAEEVDEAAEKAAEAAEKTRKALTKISNEITRAQRDRPVADFSDMDREHNRAAERMKEGMKDFAANAKKSLEAARQSVIDLKNEYNKMTFDMERPVKPLTLLEKAAREKETDNQRIIREQREEQEQYEKQLAEWHKARVAHNEKLAEQRQKIADAEQKEIEEKERIQEEAARREKQRQQELGDRARERAEAQKQFQEQMEAFAEKMFQLEEQRNEILKEQRDAAGDEAGGPQIIELDQVQATNEELAKTPEIIQGSSESLNEFNEAIGETKPIVEGINEQVEGIQTGLKETATTIGDIFDKEIERIKEYLASLEEISSAVSKRLIEIFTECTDAIQEAFGNTITSIDESFGYLVRSVMNMIRIIQTALSEVQRQIAAAKQSTASAGGGGGFSQGGRVWGAGSSTSDSIPARLSRGEFVIKAAAVRRYGAALFNALNNMTFPTKLFEGFSLGGPVLSTGRNFSKGGLVETTNTNNKAYSVINLTIGTDTFEGLLAPEHTASQLIRYSIGKQIKSAGRKPGWYR